MEVGSIDGTTAKAAPLPFGDAVVLLRRRATKNPVTLRILELREASVNAAFRTPSASERAVTQQALLVVSEHLRRAALAQET